MKSFFYLFVICLTVGVNAAQQPSPVYRSAPTVLKQVQPQARQDFPQQSQQPQTSPQQQQQPQQHQAGAHAAEEREGQVSAYASTPQDALAQSKVGAGVANPQGVGLGVQGAAGVQPSQVATDSKNPAQQYTVVYVPQREAYPGYPTTAANGQGQYQAYSGYQNPVVPGPNGAVAPASNFWDSINWKDTGVALACIALIGAGGALLYPKLAHIKARAMRELAELDAEDAKRVARNVFTAIKRFSDMNRS